VEQAPPTEWSDLEKIRYLLDQWANIFDPGPLVAQNGPGGGRDSVPLMPEVAHHPSVVELEHTLLRLALAEPVEHRHVRAFRCDVEWKIGHVWQKRTLPSGRPDWVLVRRRERLVPDWVSMGKVADGEAWIELHFRGPVYIPSPFWDALTKAA
jgi:hypothetical protein